MNELKFLIRYRRPLIILAHFLIFWGAYVLSFLLRFDFDIPSNELVGFYQVLPLIITVQMFTFGFWDQFRGLWQYAAVDDLVQLIKANISSWVVFVLIIRVLGWNFFPRSIFLLDFILSLGGAAALRFAFKFFRENLHRKSYLEKDNNILIVGAGYAGVRLLKEIRRQPNMGKVIGFIDDNPKKLLETIQNLTILGHRGDIPRIVEDYEVDEIILAIPSASAEAIRNILYHCEKTKAKIRVIPGLNKVITGEMEVKPRDVKPNDLLGRESVKIDFKEIFHYIEGRVVLVTGAGGSIGSEICRQAASFSPKELVLFDNHENFVYFLSVELKNKYPNLRIRTEIGDIRDVGLLKHLFSRTHPQVVFHAAAHKHVPLMEDSPIAAVKNNIFGTRNMIYASHHYKVERFVQISTDKAVNPINIMGMTKRVGEMILQSRSEKSYTKFMAVRFGNVLGSVGSVVPLFKQQIEYGGPITVTHPDVKRYFMSIQEAVSLVLQAGAMGKGGELFILDMGEQIKVLNIAQNLVALSGLTLGRDIQIKFTGLRPGEKLEEEILLDKEMDAVTKHDKIYMSQNKILFSRKEFYPVLKKLYRMTKVMDQNGILSLLKEIVELGNGNAVTPAPVPNRSEVQAPAIDIQLLPTMLN